MSKFNEPPIPTGNRYSGTVFPIDPRQRPADGMSYSSRPRNYSGPFTSVDGPTAEEAKLAGYRVGTERGPLNGSPSMSDIVHSNEYTDAWLDEEYGVYESTTGDLPWDDGDYQIEELTDAELGTDSETFNIKYHPNHDQIRRESKTNPDHYYSTSVPGDLARLIFNIQSIGNPDNVTYNVDAKGRLSTIDFRFTTPGEDARDYTHLSISAEDFAVGFGVGIVFENNRVIFVNNQTGRRTDITSGFSEIRLNGAEVFNARTNVEYGYERIIEYRENFNGNLGRVIEGIRRGGNIDDVTMITREIQGVERIIDIRFTINFGSETETVSLTASDLASNIGINIEITADNRIIVRQNGIEIDITNGYSQNVEINGQAIFNSPITIRKSVKQQEALVNDAKVEDQETTVEMRESAELREKIRSVAIGWTRLTQLTILIHLREQETLTDEKDTILLEILENIVLDPEAQCVESDVVDNDERLSVIVNRVEKLNSRELKEIYKFLKQQNEQKELTGINHMYYKAVEKVLKIRKLKKKVDDLTLDEVNAAITALESQETMTETDAALLVLLQARIEQGPSEKFNEIEDLSVSELTKELHDQWRLLEADNGNFDEINTRINRIIKRLIELVGSMSINQLKEISEKLESLPSYLIEKITTEIRRRERSIMNFEFNGRRTHTGEQLQYMLENCDETIEWKFIVRGSRVELTAKAGRSQVLLSSRDLSSNFGMSIDLVDEDIIITNKYGSSIPLGLQNGRYGMNLVNIIGHSINSASVEYL